MQVFEEKCDKLYTGDMHKNWAKLTLTEM